MNNGRKYQNDDQIDGSSQMDSNNNMSGLEGALGNHMLQDEENDFSEDEMGIVGGHATNLDGLDKDQIMKMIDQEVDGLGFDEDGEPIDLDAVDLELDDQIDDDEIGD